MDMAIALIIGFCKVIIGELFYLVTNLQNFKRKSADFSDIETSQINCDQIKELALGARVLKSQVFKMSLAAFLIFFVEKSTATFGHTFQYSWNIFEP